ncbi:MAG: hypothetical protein Q4F72_08195 [Desulfovibrionaceae bacterium]|nr:hypothetical protein [Desulfovibrionaceae bacterium]
MMGTRPKPDETSRPAGIAIQEVDGIKGVMLLNEKKEPVLWMRGEALKDFELRLNMKPMKEFWDCSTKQES